MSVPVLFLQCFKVIFTCFFSFKIFPNCICLLIYTMWFKTLVCEIFTNHKDHLFLGRETASWLFFGLNIWIALVYLGLAVLLAWVNYGLEILLTWNYWGLVVLLAWVYLGLKVLLACICLGLKRLIAWIILLLLSPKSINDVLFRAPN